MTSTFDAVKPPLHDEITEMQRKIQLLEGERSAYYETSQASIKNNRETILQLRQDNKKLYRRLAEAHAGDEQVIKEAFQSRGSEKAAYRNMSGQMAATALEREVLSKRKRLDAMRHATQTLRNRLEELKVQHRRMKAGGSGGGKETQKSADVRARNRQEDARKLRVLENSLEKTQLKCQEAERIANAYFTIKNHLQEESLGYQGQLDGLEEDILKHRDELRRLQAMNSDAQLSKEAAKTELQQLEESLSKERKQRESVMALYRKQVEERKAQTEKADRRAQRAPLIPGDEPSGEEAQRSTTRLIQEEEKTISSFEDAFQRIKEATGVTDVQEIVERFVSQGESQKHLEKMKLDNEQALLRLKEEKALLDQQFQDMKYSGEAKLSRDQQSLEECEYNLRLAERRRDGAKERLDALVKTLATVRAAAEHLADKLQHITLEEEEEKEEVAPSVDSEQEVVRLLARCENKLQRLQGALQGRNLADVLKDMKDEEFHVRMERKLPDYNTRIKLPDDQGPDALDGEDESDDDEANFISHEALKRQSQLILDSRTKRKPRKK